MTNLNATTQALLKFNRSFLLNMTPIQAADQGMPLVKHIIANEVRVADPVKGLSPLAEDLFREDVIYYLRQGLVYNKAILRSLFDRLPAAEALLMQTASKKVVRRLRRK